MSKKIGSNQNALELPPDLGHLPATVDALVPLYRACIVRFDAAVHRRDFEAMAAEVIAVREVIERAQSLARFSTARRHSGFRYCFYDVAHIFDRLTRAAPGAVPLFGQAGRFIASLSTVSVRFEFDGLGATIGMSGYMGAVWSFEIRAVERNRAFFTATGYRAFMLRPLNVGEPTDDVQAWCLGHLRHWWNGEGGKPTKYVLPHISPVFAPMEVAEEDLNCADCGIDLSQMDEIGECSETGEFRCPACQAEHETTCADCLPDGDADNDIEDGYRPEPVSKTSTQLSLF